jgi:magnesium chelatase subunit D
VANKRGVGRIAIMATLRAAAPFQQIRQNATMQRSITYKEYGKAKVKVEIRADDLHYKRFKDKAGVLFVFVVDASGSMALNRMREAKGAVTQLLQQAYIHRDKVALLAFRGRKAEVLLPPSQSVELAKRSLDVLPTGGGTPLASALLEAHALSEQARRQGISKTMLVLITDGRGNVLLNEAEKNVTLGKAERKQQATQEVEQLAGLIAREGLASVLLDTQVSFLSKGDATGLAQKLGARYIYLPHADAHTIAANVSDVAARLR